MIIITLIIKLSLECVLFYFIFWGGGGVGDGVSFGPIKKKQQL